MFKYLSKLSVTIVSALFLCATVTAEETPLQTIIDKEEPVEIRLKKEEDNLSRKEKRRLKRKLEGPSPSFVVLDSDDKKKEEISAMPEERLPREVLPGNKEEAKTPGVLDGLNAWLEELAETIRGEISEPDDKIALQDKTKKPFKVEPWSVAETWTEELIWGPLHNEVGLSPILEDNSDQKSEFENNPLLSEVQKTKNEEAPVLKNRGYSRRKMYAPRYPKTMQDALWTLSTKVSKKETALRLNLLADQPADGKLFYITVTTKSGLLNNDNDNENSFTWWHTDEEIHFLKRNYLYQLDVYAGKDFRKQTKYIYTDRSHKSLDVELTRWSNKAQKNKLFQYYTDIKPADNGLRWDSSYYKLTQNVIGADAWVIAHPLRMKLSPSAPEVELPYDSFRQLSREQNKSAKGLWSSLQKFKIDNIGIHVLGAQGEIRVPKSKNKLQYLYDIINEAHALGGLVGLSNPSGTIELAEGSFAPLDILLYSHAGIDFIELSNKEDEKKINELMQEGVRVPIVRSQNKNYGLELPVPNMQLLSHKGSDEASVLQTIREGRLFLGTGFNLDFYVVGKDRKRYQVGDSVPMPPSGNAVFKALAALEVNPDYGEIKSVELILNGHTAQPTKAPFGMARCSAEFKPIIFHYGDSLQLKVKRSDGSSILTNSIYFGVKPLLRKQSVRKVRVHIVIRKNNQKTDMPFSVMVKGREFFKERSIKNGEGYFELPLDSKIELYGKNQFKRFFLSNEVTKSLIAQKIKGVNGEDLKFDDIDNLFPYRLIVDLDGP